MQNVPDESSQNGLTIFGESLSTEYYKLFETVNEFDKRLLTVKGWGVTVSLLALAWGFQDQHYGLFLVAAISGAAFWLLEAVVKQHQMNYYVRMREIEVINFQLSSVHLPEGSEASSPQIDWSWDNAKEYFEGSRTDPLPAPKRRGKRTSYLLSWILPHVSFPHVVSVIAGAVLFGLGVSGSLGMPL